MDTFQIIYNKLLHSNTLSHKIHYKKNFHKKVFNYEPYNIHKKFRILTRVVYNNMLKSKNQKQNSEKIFYYSQKYYYLISKYAYKYKIKKTRIYHNNCDLNLTPFEEISERYLIRIYDKATNLIYIFNISDIINIINNSLAYMEDYKFSAIYIKNPYTNIIFNKSTLYNIYYYLKVSPFIMPELFHLFFLLNFNLQQHIVYNNTIIRRYSIKKHVTNASTDTKYTLIYHMFAFFETEVKIVISDDICKNDLVEIFKSYIYLYLLYIYSNNRYICLYSRQLLFKKFIRFSRYNRNPNVTLICNEDIMKKPIVIIEYYNNRQEEIRGETPIVDTTIVDTTIVDTTIVDTAIVDTAIVDTATSEIEIMESTTQINDNKLRRPNLYIKIFIGYMYFCMIFNIYIISKFIYNNYLINLN